MSQYIITNAEGIRLNEVYIDNFNIGIGIASPSERLEIDGGIKISSATTSPVAGTIEWDGSHFRGFDGFMWLNLDDGIEYYVDDEGIVINTGNTISLDLDGNTLSKSLLGLKVEPGNIRLDELGSPLNNVSFGNVNIINLANPTSNMHAANKLYVDSLAAGQDPKQSCRLATTGSNVNVSAAPNTLDSVSIVLGNRILVKDQTDPKQNGIYVVQTVGTGANGVWARSTDADGSSTGIVSGGTFTFIEQGSTNAGSGWVVVGDGVRSIGVNNIVWTQFTITGPSSPSVTYSNANPTPSDIGGIESGSTFVSRTMQQMWDHLLYPYQYPAFSSFAITGYSGSYEMGYTIPQHGNTFTWLTTNSANVSPNTLEISGDSLTTLSGLANDSTESFSFTAPVTRTSNGSKTWTIEGTNTASTTFNTTLTLYWRWRWYWGVSTNTTLIETEIEALTSNALKSTYAGTFTFGTTGYKYYCYPDAMGGVSSFSDSTTLLPVAMADSTDGYTNLENGLYYDLVSVTNSNAITTNYRVYRTKNVLGGAINIIIA